MWLTRLFVNRPALVFVMIAFVTVAGVIAYKNLTQQQFPNVDLPTITVQVNYPGASPSEMRDDIVRPIEDSIAGAPDLNVINATVLQGRAVISAVFNLSTDQTTALVQVQQRVQAAAAQLPTDLKAPEISTVDPGEATVVTLAVRSNSYSIAGLSDIVTNQIVPAIEQINGVGFADVNGTVTPSYEVTVDPVALQAGGFTVNDVVNSLSGNNSHLPGGIVYEPTRETLVDVRGDIQTPDQVANLPLMRSGAAIPSSSPSSSVSSTPSQLNPWSATSNVPRVGDVASIADSYEPRRVYAYQSGVPRISISVQKTTQANEVSTSDNVIAALPHLESQFPGIKFDVVNVQSNYTRQQIDAVIHTLEEGILLTAIVMLFFLGSWRSSIVVLIAIPFSLLITMVLMKFANFTIDTVSLLAMTLVVGILVDDSIVVLENIERHHREGEQPLVAAVNGRSEIGFAAIVITLVDVVVFLPIAFLPGVVGKFMSEFALVVVGATLTSLWTSFTVTPALAGRWSLRSKWKPWRPIATFERWFERLRVWYAETLLPAALRVPKRVALIAVASFVLAIVLLGLGVVGFTFIPSVDRGEIYVQVTWPTGTPLTKVNAAMRQMESIARQIPDLQTDIAVAGAYSSPFGGFLNEGNVGQIHLWLKDGRKQSTIYWVDWLRTHLRPAARGSTVVVIPATASGGGNQQPMDYLVTDVRGDPTQYAQQVYQILKDTPGTANVNSSALNLAPQVNVEFNRLAAQALDVSIGTASTAVRAAMGGVVATQFESANGLKDVYVVFPFADQTSLDQVRNIQVRANNGSIVTIGQIATLQYAPAPPVITRTNRETVIHITANTAPGYALSNVQNAFLRKLKAADLPAWVQVRANPNGNQQNLADTLLGMGAALALSMVLVYLLMVALYNGYITPFIIMFSVPVAAVGAVGALAITRQTLNLFSLIGVIMLVGLVSKNGILLVDYANTLRRRGYAKLEAMRQSARIRFRPILMTTCAMIAGMTPLALGIVPGSQVRQALGIVVIGGLSSSLALTLVLVPVVYMWLAPERLAPTDEVPPPASPGPPISFQPSKPETPQPEIAARLK
ncbi:MAG: efflux RND transporter permease subunit [Candidatus Eremiobacteraeota bacterium]|nr:efflux RND transporter permease subunit [Candidatus Eremiobacteraeota bacterium]